MLVRLVFFFSLVGFLSSCEKILEVQRFEGPCTIELVDGRTIVTQFSIEILESTGTITYRDDDGKLGSVKADEYSGYSCGN